MLQVEPGHSNGVPSRFRFRKKTINGVVIVDRYNESGVPQFLTQILKEEKGWALMGDPFPRKVYKNQKAAAMAHLEALWTAKADELADQFRRSTERNVNRPDLKFSEETANAIYDILVKVLMAPESHRRGFTLHPDILTEWRFQGCIGFGGKFRNHDRDRIFVDCYREEESPYNRMLLAFANIQLQELFLKTWGRSTGQM